MFFYENHVFKCFFSGSFLPSVFFANHRFCGASETMDGKTVCPRRCSSVLFCLRREKIRQFYQELAVSVRKTTFDRTKPWKISIHLFGQGDRLTDIIHLLAKKMMPKRAVMRLKILCCSCFAGKRDCP